MENEEINLTSTDEIENDLFQKKTEESLSFIQESELNTASKDDKEDLQPDISEDNSVVTFASISVASKTIKVHLRLKPFPSEIELTREQEDAYTVVNSTTLLTKFPGFYVNARSLKNLKSSERVCRTFTFTSAFGPGISQTEFFDEAITPQIDNFLAGQSSTVMSYGTSNAGKSYTLYGVPSALGIIPMSINFIFGKVKSTLSTPWYKPINQNHVIGLSSTDRVRELEIRDKLLSFESSEKTEFINAYQAIRETLKYEEVNLDPRQDEHVIYSVWISFAEIYNDAIYDLLSSDWPKKRLPLKMVTDKQGRTFIKDLRTVYVNSDEEAYQILLAGQYRSRIAATTLNSRSSRSHCIFTIKLLKYYAESATDDVEVSALSFCDLAGSGRLKMNTNIRDRLKETQNINTSLLVLGRCLKSIWEGQSVRQKSEVVGPFRESKLTRLFQKALSGKEPITLIVNVNPVPSLYAETQNVLNFSAIAKKIIVEPVKKVKKNMFTTRFSRVVSQSVKTVTDWDHAAVEDSTHEIYSEEAKNSDYIPRECYDDLSVEYEKMKEEYVALKNSMIDKDLEIREEMASTYTGLINNLEANWRSRSKDVEEQQEHLLAWSVSQVENFYKEKLNRLNSRKRRRWDDGDAVDDREADIRDMEAENASLTAKILVKEETIKQLRSAKENAIAEKNKSVFELSLVKEEIIGVKKMLEAAENDIRCEKDGAHFTHELKKQLSSREERIKSLKEFLNEAKEEYIRITSDASRMQEELKEANATLIENAEKIEDLEEQLDQSNIFLGQRAKEIEQLTEKLEYQSTELTEFEKRARNAEEILKESESIRLNLIGTVKDLNRLHKVAYTPENFNYSELVSTNSEMNMVQQRNIAQLVETKIVSEKTNVELENLPDRREIDMHIKDGILDTDESLHETNQKSFKLRDSSEINDSGIAMGMGSANQTMEHTNSTVDIDLEIKNKDSQTGSATTYDKNSGDEKLRSMKLENAKQESENVDSSNSPEACATEYGNNLESIETELRLVDVNEVERELQFADIIEQFGKKIAEYENNIDMPWNQLTTRMDKERFNSERLDEKVSRLETQFSEVSIRVKTEVTKCFNEQEARIERLEKEFSELKEQDDSESQPTQKKIDNTLEKDILQMLSKVNQRVKDLEVASAEYQSREDDQHKQLLDGMERLSYFESQIQNWPIEKSQDEKSVPSLYEKLQNDVITNVTEDGNQPHVINSDLHRSQVAGNKIELCSKANTQSNEDFHQDFRGSDAFERYRNDETYEWGNHITSLQNEEAEKKHRRLKSENTCWGKKTSLTAIDLLKAPSSTPRGSASSHSDAKTIRSRPILGNISSISRPKSVIPIGGRSQMSKEKVFQQATDDSMNSQSEPHHEILSASKRQNVKVVTRLTNNKKNEKLSDPVRGSNHSSSEHFPGFLSDKFVAAPLMGSRWVSEKSKPLIRKNEVYVEPEPKQKPVMRNKKLR